MKIFKRILCFVASAVLACGLFSSCLNENELQMNLPKRISVSVDADDYSVGTKSSYEGSENAVSSVQYLVYNSTGDYATGKYFSGGVTGTKFSIRDDGNYTFLILCNCDEIPEASIPATLSAARSMRVNFSSQLVSDGLYPGGLPMALDTTFSVTENMDVVFHVRRLVSKWDIRVENDDQEELGFYVSGVTMKNCATSVQPWQAGSKITSASDAVDGDWGTDGDLSIMSLNFSTGGITFAPFYVLENAQGSVSGISDPTDKNPSHLGGKAGLATYAEVLLSFPEDGDWFRAAGEHTAAADIIYRVYLGQNGTDNLDIIRNTANTLRIRDNKGSILFDVEYGITEDSWQAEYHVVPVDSYVPTNLVFRYPFYSLSLVDGAGLWVDNPASATPLKGRTIVYSSEDPSVATVDATGRITAVGAGTTRIMAFIPATTSGTTVYRSAVAYCDIEVTWREMARLELDPSDWTGYWDESFTITPVVKVPETGNIEWESSDPTVATVDAGGVVTALAPGECVIYAKLSATNYTPAVATCYVSVAKKPANLKFTPSFVESTGYAYAGIVLSTDSDADVVTSSMYEKSIQTFLRYMRASDSGMVTYSVDPELRGTWCTPGWVWPSPSLWRDVSGTRELPMELSKGDAVIDRGYFVVVVQEENERYTRGYAKLNFVKRDAGTSGYIYVTPESITARRGSTYTITADIDRNSLSKKVYWSTSDASRVSISSSQTTAGDNGSTSITITVSETAESGNVTITARDDYAHSATCKVTIFVIDDGGGGGDEEETWIEVNPNPVSMYVNSGVELKASTNSDGVIHWTENSDVIRLSPVSANGVTGKTVTLLSNSTTGENIPITVKVGATSTHAAASCVVYVTVSEASLSGGLSAVVLPNPAPTDGTAVMTITSASTAPVSVMPLSGASYAWITSGPTLVPGKSNVWTCNVKLGSEAGKTATWSVTQPASGSYLAGSTTCSVSTASAIAAGLSAEVLPDPSPLNSTATMYIHSSSPVTPTVTLSSGGNIAEVSSGPTLVPGETTEWTCVVNTKSVVGTAVWNVSQAGNGSYLAGSTDCSLTTVGKTASGLTATFSPSSINVGGMSTFTITSSSDGAVTVTGEDPSVATNSIFLTGPQHTGGVYTWTAAYTGVRGGSMTLDVSQEETSTHAPGVASATLSVLGVLSLESVRDKGYVAQSIPVAYVTGVDGAGTVTATSSDITVATAVYDPDDRCVYSKCMRPGTTTITVTGSNSNTVSIDFTVLQPYLQFSDTEVNILNGNASSSLVGYWYTLPSGGTKVTDFDPELYASLLSPRKVEISSDVPGTTVEHLRSHYEMGELVRVTVKAKVYGGYSESDQYSWGNPQTNKDIGVGAGYDGFASGKTIAGIIYDGSKAGEGISAIQVAGWNHGTGFYGNRVNVFTLHTNHDFNLGKKTYSNALVVTPKSAYLEQCMSDITVNNPVVVNGFGGFNLSYTYSGEGYAMNLSGTDGSTTGVRTVTFKAMGETRTIREYFMFYNINHLYYRSYNSTTTGWTSANANDKGNECTVVAYRLGNEASPWTSVADMDCVKTTVGNSFYTNGLTHYDASAPENTPSWHLGYADGVPSGQQAVSGYPHYNMFKWIWQSDGTCITNGHTVTVEANDKVCLENGDSPNTPGNGFYNVVISNDLFGKSCVYLKLGSSGQDYLERGYYILYL